MKKQEILDLLHRHLDEIQQRFDVKQLGLFGSAARDEMTEKSDVDVLVEFKGYVTFDGYMDLKFFLEELFHRDVDLVTRDSIKPRMRPIIEKDEIRVA
ncbi:MAG: nucleotidyltransferase family protein [Gammaproteobacteria bacterium]|nr:nucleotidyltransferase family protein [Gammaproteobacteria bacterium]